MLDRDIQDPRITAIERTGYPMTQSIKPTFRPELVEVVEYEKESGEND